jgi:hypothetical protein
MLIKSNYFHKSPLLTSHFYKGNFIWILLSFYWKHRFLPTHFMFLWWNIVPKMTRDILVDPSPLCVIWWHYHDPHPLRVSPIIWMAPYRKNGLSSSISWTRVMGQMRKTHGSQLESGKILIISTSWYISPSSVTFRRISLTDIWKKDRCYQALIMSLVGPRHC